MKMQRIAAHFYLVLTKLTLDWLRLLGCRYLWCSACINGMCKPTFIKCLKKNFTYNNGNFPTSHFISFKTCYFTPSPLYFNLNSFITSDKKYKSCSLATNLCALNDFFLLWALSTFLMTVFVF